MRRIAVALAVVLCCGVAVAEEPGSRSFTREYAIPAGSPLEIGLKVGEMTVETAPIDKVVVEVTARCREESEQECFRRLEGIQTEALISDESSTVRVTGVSKRYHRMEVKAKFTVPEDSSLAVRMYAGELDVEGGGQDLDIRLKFGDVTVHQPLVETQSVLADANFGDAEIHTESGDPEPRRPFLVGSRVTWEDGEGDAAVAVNLSAGSAVVYLD